MLLARGIEQFSMKPVKRLYCFEREDIPRGAQYVLKVRYPALNAPLPADLKGNNFVCVLGTQTGVLEHLMIKSRVMGPSWLALKGAAAVPQAQQASWCKLEVNIAGAHKSVRQTRSDAPTRDPPKLTVAALNLKTVVNHRQNVNEIASASVVYVRDVRADAATSTAVLQDVNKVRHFSCVRRLDGVSMPPGWDQLVSHENTHNPAARRSKSIVLSSQTSERGLLSFLLARLQQLDADVIVGHNIAGFDLDVLLHRLQSNKVPLWSRIGRLKRTRFPNLNGSGGGGYGGGASIGAMSCVAGRLLADTYLASREFIKEVSYTLTSLAQNQLKMTRHEIPSADIPGKFSTAPNLLSLTKATEHDAWLSLGLLFHLSVIPLSKQLSNIAGITWSKTLQHTRAARVEHLLLHEFHARKYLLPDKLSAKERKHGRGGGGEDDMGDGEIKTSGKKKGGPAYAGGLVLEPKKGLYDKYVLMLDFNSLYPSIIQEYDICFTTVNRPKLDPADLDAPAPPVQLPEPPPGGPGGPNAAVLPQVIRKLVQRRKDVKNILKTERNPAVREQLDIRQLAFKLTANSMYGCLGFAASRFYAKPLAELTTLQGREILQSTVDLAQGTLGLDVVYGDTDSIMVNTNSNNLSEVMQIGQSVKKEVNKRYRLLEIEIDGVYKSMLLLKKKKYAALKVEHGIDGAITTVMEQKGLDIVRRDWSLIAKAQGNRALDLILSGRPAEDVVEDIHESLRKCREDLIAGAVTMDQFVITKQLTKRPEDYPDASSQAHVQVALRLRAAGKHEGTNQGETVPYVIAVKTDASGEDIASGKCGTSGGKGLADRAYHPDAKPLAELTTLQGREILQSTVDLAQGTLGLDVVYGDTDSIMVNTNSNNLSEVMQIGQSVKKEVNKRYRLLEIEIDGVYKSMLLLKKKKYAALKVEHGIDGAITTVMEQKGLDIVRRDWSLIAKAQGNRALDLILSGRPAEDVVEDIHESLRKCREDLIAGAVTMDQFVITKQLTKRPEDYPDASSQAHVQVALRLRAAGKHEGTNQGETVPYVIAVKTDASGEDIASGKCGTSGGKGLADRAYHPDEVTAEGSGLKLDLHYYLTQQVHPVVSRLCQPIEGTDAARIADCLGLDPSKFHHQVVQNSSGGDDDDFLNAGSALDDEERFKSCTPLTLKTKAGKFDFPGVTAILKGQVDGNAALAPPPAKPEDSAKENAGDANATAQAQVTKSPVVTAVRPLSGHALANQVRLAVRQATMEYYASPLRSDDELAPAETRNVSLRVAGEGTGGNVEPGTLPGDPKLQGIMSKMTSEASLYTQLVHFRRLLSVPDALQRMPEKERDAARARVPPATAEALRLAVDAVDETLERSAYRWINLRELYGVAGIA